MKMKRILSVTVALLLLMLALAGCGGSQEEPAETETTEVTETAEPEPAEETESEAADSQEAEPASADSSPLMNLAAQMIEQAGITDAIPVSADALANVYGLDPAQIVSAAGYNASASGAFPQEIILVQTTDPAAVAEAFNKRLGDIAAQAESYDPDSLALAQKCAVVTKGDYVGLFFSEHYDQLAELFQNGLN